MHIIRMDRNTFNLHLPYTSCVCFQSLDLFFYTAHPDVTPCFEFIPLTWAPVGLLLLLCCFSLIHHIGAPTVHSISATSPLDFVKKVYNIAHSWYLMVILPRYTHNWRLISRPLRRAMVRLLPVQGQNSSTVNIVLCVICVLYRTALYRGSYILMCEK